MKIVLQHRLSGLYVGDDGSWPHNSEEALLFDDTTAAIKYCRLHELREIQIVMKFGGEEYDVRLPVSSNHLIPGN